MDDRLGVDDNFYFVGGEVEEPAGFDDLQGLVEHGGRVDGDFGAHSPGGVIEGLGEGGVFDFVGGGASEGASAGGEDDAADFVESAGVGRLEDRGMLGIHGEEADVLLAGEGDEQGA